MFIQNPTIPDVAQHAKLLNIAFTILYAFFTIMIFRRYMKNKSKVAKNLAINFGLYTIISVILTIQYVIIEEKGAGTEEESWLGATFMALVCIATIFMYLFYTELDSKSLEKKKIVSILGMSLSAWILLPFDDMLGIVFITYALMLFYNGYVYLKIGLALYKTINRVPEKRKALIAIVVGCFLFLVFFLLVAVAGILNHGILLLASLVVLFLTMTSFYFGFIHPSLKSK